MIIVLMKRMVMLKFSMIILVMETKYVIVMNISNDKDCTTVPIPDETVMEGTIVMAFKRKTRVINGGVTATGITLKTDFYRQLITEVKV